MDPTLTVIFVAAFLLAAFAAFGGIPRSKPQRPPIVDPIAGMNPFDVASPEPPSMTTRQRLQPLLRPICWTAVIGVGLFMSFSIYRVVNGVSVSDYLQGAAKNTAANISDMKGGAPVNFPEMKGASPPSFQSPAKQGFDDFQKNVDKR
jgi:hypothetical protein